MAKRLTNEQYLEKRASIDPIEFRQFFLENCNEAVCAKYSISMNVMRRLQKDFRISLTEDEAKTRNKRASEQRFAEKHSGYKNAFSMKETQDKVRASVMWKYGAENVFAASEIKERIRQTNLARRGHEYASQSEDVKERSRETCLLRYGVDNYAKTEECKERIKATNLLRHGHENAGQFGSDEFKKSCLLRYGAEHPIWTDEMSDKAQQTNRIRYGVAWYAQTMDHQRRLRARYTCDGEAFDSLPELAVWVWCRDRSIQIKRLPTSFEYKVEGKTRRCFPDFEIDGQLVEIKGDHFFKEDGTMQNPFDHSQDAVYEAKRQCLMRNGVEIWSSERYTEALKYLLENYSVAELKLKKISS